MAKPKRRQAKSRGSRHRIHGQSTVTADGESPAPPQARAAVDPRTEEAKTSTVQKRRQMDRDDLWDDLRQGARNVAGVSWQLDVCAYLLVASRAGDLPFAELVPEGFEDADCLAADGSRVFVQMKELGGGDRTLRPSDLADALAHAEASARGAKIVVVTDGRLGAGLRSTGWDRSLADHPNEGMERVFQGLVTRSYTPGEASNILARSSLVQLDYRVRQRSEAMLSTALSTHPAVAGIAVSELTGTLARLSADQRKSSRQGASRVRASDLDQIIAKVQETVDVTGLDGAVAMGICSPVSFLKPEQVRPQIFYLGVDGRPDHVAADLDVIRPVELHACAEGLRNEGNVLLVGPSGSGKSVLLWRAARDLVPGARVLRVGRVSDEDDARVLARHVRLLRPSSASPVMVVADDLGRPNTTGWAHAARLLREIPSVLLMGAARAEDFTPTLLVGPTRVVEPSLDPALADSLGQHLKELGVFLRMAPREALVRADGLLMEYLALLTTGQRLRQVLATQVAELKDSDRTVQREAARLVTTAHTMGLSISAERLGRVLADESRGGALARVGDALSVLRNEHIVVSDGDSWRGLHELRSATISQLLHESPPPTIAQTLTELAAVVAPPHAGWMLRKVAEHHPEAVSRVAAAFAQSLNADGATVADLSAFLEGAERADNALYVQAAFPVLEQSRLPGVSVEHVAFLAYPRRNQSAGFDEIGSPDFDKMVRRIRTIADGLPMRSAFETTIQAACAGLDQNLLEEKLSVVDAVDAVRLLEAGQPYLKLSPELAKSLVSRMDVPYDLWSATVWSRLAAVCHPLLLPSEVNEVLGTPTDRVGLLCAADPTILDASVEDDDTVTVKRLLPLDGTGCPVPRLPWDIPRAGSKDCLNASTVFCAEILKDACPELQRFEIITVTASGQPYCIHDDEPGHKDLQRATFPNRRSVRQAVGFQAALRRAISSETWTEIVSNQVKTASELTTAATELPLRFNPYDNKRRRADWRVPLAAIRERLGSLRPPPLPSGSAPSSALGLDDHSDRAEDNTTRVLRAALDAIDNACSQEKSHPRAYIATAISLRDAADEIDAARLVTRTVLHEHGEVLPHQLTDAMRRGANLAAALDRRPGLITHVDASNPLDSADTVWHAVVVEEQERAASTLKDLLDGIPDTAFVLAEDPDPASWALSSRSWVVLAPIEVFDVTLAAIETLNDDARQLLGPNVVLLAVLGIVADAPLEPGSQPDPQLSSLGFGVRLSSSARRKSLPLPPEVAVAWAQNVGLQVVAGVESPVVVVEELIRRSHEAARLRLRRLSSKSSAESNRQPTAYYDVDRRDIEASSVRTPEAQTALTLLETHVAAEEQGLTSTCLAEVIFRTLTDIPLDAEAERLLSALAVLNLDRLGESVPARQPNSA